MLPETRPRKRRRMLLLAVALSAATALLATELLLRAVGLPEPMRCLPQLWGGEDRDASTLCSDERVFYRLRPGNSVWPPNPLGMRGYLPPEAKHDSEFRICVLGDSVAAGHCVEYDEAFTAVLARELQTLAPGSLITPILGGLPGWSTYQNLELWRADLHRYAPDILVLCCGTCNDGLPAFENGDREFARRARADRSRPRLVQLVTRVVQRIRQSSHTFEYMREQAMHGNLLDGRRVEPAEFASNLRELIAAARSIAAEPILLVPTQIARVRKSQPHHEDYRKAVRDVAAAEHVRLIDTGAVMERSGHAETELFVDEMHPTPLGHELMAKALLDSLLLDPAAKLQAALARRATPAVVCERVVMPPHVDCSSDVVFQVFGRGFTHLGDADMLRVDGTWIRSRTTRSDDCLEATLPGPHRPGRLTIEIATTTGLVHGPTFELPPVPLTATRDPANPHTLRLALRAVANCEVEVFASEARAEVPAPTRCGGWELVGERRDLPCVRSMTDATGKCEAVLTLPERVAGNVFVQGIVWVQKQSDHGCATACVPVAAR